MNIRCQIQVKNMKYNTQAAEIGFCWLQLKCIAYPSADDWWPVKSKSVDINKTACQAHLGKESVDKDSLELAKAVDSEDTLDVIGGVPRGIKDDDPVGCHQVDAKRSGTRWNEEQTTSGESIWEGNKQESQ